MKYTALELLKHAGVPEPEKQFGTVGISIAGVNANKADKVINMQDAKKVTALVGDKSYEGELPAQTEPSEAVKKALEAKGRAATEAREAVKKPKAEPEK